MTYTLTCPNPDCNEEWQHEADPAALEDGGDLIKCETCQEEWEWEYDAEADALVLLEDDFEDCEELEDDEDLEPEADEE